MKRDMCVTSCIDDTVISAVIIESAVRWKDWILLVNRIVEFVKTGKIETSISAVKQEEIAKAAQIYYIECRYFVVVCLVKSLHQAVLVYSVTKNM